MYCLFAAPLDKQIIAKVTRLRIASIADSPLPRPARQSAPASLTSRGRSYSLSVEGRMPSFPGKKPMRARRPPVCVHATRTGRRSQGETGRNEAGSPNRPDRRARKPPDWQSIFCSRRMIPSRLLLDSALTNVPPLSKFVTTGATFGNLGPRVTLPIQSHAEPRWTHLGFCGMHVMRGPTGYKVLDA